MPFLESIRIEWLLYALMPFMTAGIGWLTNWLAIKMLFRPRKVKNILGWRCQGLIPRRQKDLADQCAEIIERELIQQDMIEKTIRSLDIAPLIEEKIKNLIREKLVAKLKALPMIGAFINSTSLSAIEEIAAKEMIREAESLLESISAKAAENFQIKEIVREKIELFDLDKLEGIVMTVASKEFKTIELLGAVLGFIIGVVQLVFLVIVS